jgi:hypothetical protein
MLTKEIGGILRDAGVKVLNSGETCFDERGTRTKS